MQHYRNTAKSEIEKDGVVLHTSSDGALLQEPIGRHTASTIIKLRKIFGLVRRAFTGPPRERCVRRRLAHDKLFTGAQLQPFRPSARID